MKIRDNKWAEKWLEATPLGNGHMGAMIYSNPIHERIKLSEQTFYSGEKSINDNQKNASLAFQKMRKLLGTKEGQQEEEALREADNFIGVRNNYGTNLPVAVLCVDWQGKRHEEVESYERELDLEQGVLTSTYFCGDEKWNSTSFLSHPDKLLVYTRNQNKEKVSTNNTFILYMEKYRDADIVLSNDNSICFTCHALEELHSDGKTGVTLKGQVFVETDGVCTAADGKLYITNASTLTIFVMMKTDYETGAEKIKDLHFASPSKPFAEYLERHRKDISTYMKRVSFQLDSMVSLETQQIPVLYQFGRYLLLSSSREDSALPAHLQGIWNDNVACLIGWTCDMHLDINTQMNYWSSEVANLPECGAPLFSFIINKLAVSGKRTAEESYGLKGWIAELVTNAWAFTAPYWAKPIAPCPTGGVWIATHLWEHYLYTGDENFLAQSVYPVIEEAVLFFSEYVFFDAEKKAYVSGPSISPENSYLSNDGKKYQMDIGCTYEILMIRELFHIYLEASKLLKKKNQLIQKTNQIYENLLPYSVTKTGTLAEWSNEYLEYDKQHRHTSHLLGVYPFHQITPEATPELAKAVRKSICQKLSPKENWEDTGWARSLMILYSARLWDGEWAHQHITDMMKGLLAHNRMIIHPPTRGAASFDNVYELDGNTGFTAGISEMLLQSHMEYVHILPALPKAWIAGEITGLKARGNIEVDIKWDAVTGVKVTIRSKVHNQCKIRYREQWQSVELNEECEREVIFILYRPCCPLSTDGINIT